MMLTYGGHADEVPRSLDARRMSYVREHLRRRTCYLSHAFEDKIADHTRNILACLTIRYIIRVVKPESRSEGYRTYPSLS